MFVHLRLHSEYSIVDGIVRVDDAVASAAAQGQGALAITDLNNLFGAIKFYQAARAGGVKPIIGCELTLQMPSTEGLTSSAHASTHTSAQTAPRLLVLVQNHSGYLNLCKLITRSWARSGVNAQGLCQWEWLAEHAEGLIALSGAQAGPLGRAFAQGDSGRATELAQCLAQWFAGRFYIELQRAGRPDDEAHIAAAVPLAAQLGLPVVATHPIQFLHPDDYEAHEARVCIAEGEILGNPRRVRRFMASQYFKSSEQMQQLFADIPSALHHSAQIAQRCNLELNLGQARLPNFPTPNNEPVEQHFRALAQQGLAQRLSQLYPDAQARATELPRYQQRLEFEMDTIIKMGFAGYFLIVSDFINWAKTNGCPVGPGRGSGAGSLVAYVLNITGLDPLHYQLLFERFLNPERISMPDFDIDFCQTNRDRVIEYVKNRYGKDTVSQIATFGTMAARAVLRDVGRVLDMSYTFCDGIAKLIPAKPGTHVTLADALKSEPVLAERAEKEDEVKNLLALAQKLEGLARNVGMHAGGVLIAPGQLTDFCPLYQQPGSDAAISQYDKNDVESAGLVKFDFLGLATLTILELAKNLIRQRHPGQAAFDYDNVPFDDPKVYRLFQQAQTEAVFQFESSGMRGMLRDAKPERLGDLIALNALFRPGPMDLIPSFIARKTGREPVEYPHPLAEPVLAETYGVMVYQEQVMQVAQVLGGYSLGAADVLRRAMGKKKPEEMAQQRGKFRAGAAHQGIDEVRADEIFDLMEKFAGYGFNKSHAAAYSVLAYQTAWLKVHYSVEFYCANMTVEMDNTDKLKSLYDDALERGLEFEPPNVNRCSYAFEPVNNKCLRYGLGAIKGTGQQAIEALVEARNSGGAFTSLYDFCARVDRTRINKRAIEALIKAGGFDCVQANRAALLAALETAFEYANAVLANTHQTGLFDAPSADDGPMLGALREPDLPATTPWGVRERLVAERAALGFYYSGHFFDTHADEVRRFADLRIADIDNRHTHEPKVLVGIFSDLRYINTARGRLAIFKLDDKSATIEVTIDAALLEANRHVLMDDELIILRVKIQLDRFSNGFRVAAQQVWDIAGARCHFGKYLRVAVNGQAPDIAAIVRDFPPQRVQSDYGEQVRALPVRLLIERNQLCAELVLDEQARFFPSNEALQTWVAQAAGGQAQVVYQEAAA